MKREVSWEIGTHTNRLWACQNDATHLAFGIGNEGNTAFKVCDNHSKVAELRPDLWAIEELSQEEQSK